MKISDRHPYHLYIRTPGCWSRFYQAETAIRMKILEEKDSYEAIATHGSWLGKDPFEYIKNLRKHVYQQLDNIDNCGAVQSHLEGNKGNYTFFALLFVFSR